MFDMALTRPSLTVQLTSGMDVFAHVSGQNADTLSNYCDNIQPHDKRRFCFVKCDMIVRSFVEITTSFRTSNFQKVVRQRGWEVVYEFCWKFTYL